ncbi:MAG: hypothetical protein P8O16_09290 [Algoriphagus sp.]|uniref:hypothetical protein n=1 Tax=Algoriphagus sp. TaxID=1872435 RepID=UPI0026312F29|nr:hypothetical protein [Algoriphagus sp.]MDG1277462.1 hypothetical protein [Algoriphagus sp.]
MRKFILLSFFLASFQLMAQDNQLGNPIAEIQLENLDLISFDNKDNLFASNTSGDIYQFDRFGKKTNLFSPSRQGRLNQLEAAWTVNIFSFSADLQEYRIFDRFLNPLAESNLLLADVNLVKAATFGNNNTVWVWDESDLSIKSLDYLRNLVIQSQPLNLILNSDDLEVLEIREFKNRLFMNIKNEGIFIFDNQGNLIKMIKMVLNQKMCFYNEYLLWTEEGFLMSISIKSQAIFKIAPIKNLEPETIQIGQNRLALIQKNKVILYELPNWLKSLR